MDLVCRKYFRAEYHALHTGRNLWRKFIGCEDRPHLRERDKLAHVAQVNLPVEFLGQGREHRGDCAEIQCAPEGIHARQSLYIGDDHRDVQAGRGAGMRTLAAAWGYLGRGESIEQWNADAVLSAPAELLNWLGMA